MGWPNASSDDMIGKRLRLASGPIEYVRKYHGYAFSWAVIYTFWYHPMENTFGHVMGFIHTFLVMIQGRVKQTTNYTISSLTSGRTYIDIFVRLLVIHGLF